MAARKTLLLAGAGDLAQRAAGHFLARFPNARVIGVRRQPPPTAGHIEWLAGDLTDPACIAALPSGITHILYTATPDARDADAYRRIFITAPDILLAGLDATALERLLFVSSTAVYADDCMDTTAAPAWTDEQTQAEPDSFNGQILLEAEQHFQQQLPARTVTLRCAGLYGPGRTHLLRRLLAGHAHVPPVARPRWINRIHIEDAARACVHLLALPEAASCYIGSDGQPQSMRTFYEALASMLGAPAPAEDAQPHTCGKRLSNARLLASGFELHWPDPLAAYALQIKALHTPQ
ncbi:MAG: NAD-dependent epimerase/dehydratase family protein [Corticimicrobacter sp.]|uniref:NAD-dependent epimerase/dehydratase family protein n=1 Tax=Corticimicrobacter sp. TaxID=2678536 RepID=UPI0032DAA3AF